MLDHQPIYRKWPHPIEHSQTQRFQRGPSNKFRKITFFFHFFQSPHTRACTNCLVVVRISTHISVATTPRRKRESDKTLQWPCIWWHQGVNNCYALLRHRSDRWQKRVYVGEMIWCWGHNRVNHAKRVSEQTTSPKSLIRTFVCIYVFVRSTLLLWYWDVRALTQGRFESKPLFQSMYTCYVRQF